MAVATYALTTLAAVQQELRAYDSELDPLLESIIDAVSLQIETFTRRKLKARTYKPSGATAGEENLKLNGDGRISGSEMLFPQYPLNSISSLVVRDADLTNPETVDVANNVVFDPDTALVRILNGSAFFKRGMQNVECEFNAGFSTVPPDLARAATLLAKWAYQQSDRMREGISSVSAEGQTVSYIQRAMPPDIEFMVTKYKRPWPKA